MILLLELHSYAQSHVSLKDQIFFYPCGKPNTTSFDQDRLIRIMNYIDSIDIKNFALTSTTQNFAHKTNYTFIDKIDNCMSINAANSRFSNVGFMKYLVVYWHSDNDTSNGWDFETTSNINFAGDQIHTPYCASTTWKKDAVMEADLSIAIRRLNITEDS